MQAKTKSTSKPMRQARTKKALRAAFVVTGAVVAAGCGGGSNNDDIQTNPPFAECPDGVPQQGGSCELDVGTCNYIDDCSGGDVEASCEGDGTWSVTYDSTCNPPPPLECPEEVPTAGDECDIEIGSCSYTDECGISFSADCDGTWSIGEAFESCNPPPPCPAELPAEGAICESSPGGTPQDCSYEVETACGTQTVSAECELPKDAKDFVWVLDAPPCKT